MLEIIPKSVNIDFVGKRYIFIAISALAVIGSLVLMATKGLNYGIDFTGGAVVQLKFKDKMPVGELRSTMESGGFKNLVVQEFGEPELNEYLVKFRGDESQLQQISNRVEQTLSAKMTRGDFELQRVDVVGPQAGSELRKSGFLAMFYTLLCILIYVAIRFDFRYAPGAVMALFHDSIITLGIFVLTQKEFSLQIVAAILIIIGYSNNDTIIVFDRVRETSKAYPNRSFADNINRSINETLSRTLLTSITTAFSVVALFVFGGGIIHDFAFTMLIGILVGSYSSVFIASPLVLFLDRLQDKREKKSSGALRSKPAT